LSRRFASIFLIITLVIAVGWWLGRPAEPPRAPVVLAAASLQESMEAAADAWAAKGHARPVLSFAASSALARQVEAGAPADIFVSADEEWLDTLQDNGLIRPGTRAKLVGNRLVLIAPSASTLALKAEPGIALASALDDGRLALADPQGVPAGRYARQALEKFGVWDEVSDRIASADNVRGALALVARGEAPLGIVYATDAAAEPRVRVVATFPEDSHTPITYPVAVLATSRHPDAQAFRDFLLSPEAQALFRRFGFTAAGPGLTGSPVPTR